MTHKSVLKQGKDIRHNSALTGLERIDGFPRMKQQLILHAIGLIQHYNLTSLYRGVHINSVSKVSIHYLQIHLFPFSRREYRTTS